MQNERYSLLNVPVTEAERGRMSSQFSQSSTDGSRTLVSTPESLLHARDRQFSPHIGRFSSLRHPGERYDDPEQYNPRKSENTLRPLPDIDEESFYSDHHDEEHINPGTRATTFPRTSPGAYQPVRNPPPTQPQPSTQRFWQPIWLMRLSLASLTLLILGVIGALLGVCHLSDVYNGLAMTSPADHYAWTYVPTAIMVILVGLLRQVDFHTKTLMPWKELRYGPTTPYDSILAEYISDFQIFAFLTALKRFHVPVMTTVAAFILAKCMTIASTGLFYPQPVTLSSGFPTSVSSQFDASALDASILTTTNFPNTSVYTYYQNVENGQGSTLGVASGFAYTLPVLQSNSTPIPANVIFNATTDTFVPSISCRPANVTLRSNATIQTVNFPYNSTSLPYGSPSNLTFDIHEDSLCSSWPQLNFRGLDPLHYIVPNQTLESQSQQLSCQDPGKDPIILLMLVETLYSQTLLKNVSRPQGGRLPIAVNASRSVSRMTSVLCQADYTLSQINITNNTVLDGLSAITFHPLQNPQNRTLNGLTPANMTTIFSTLLGSVNGLFPQIPASTNRTELLRTPAFDLLQFTAGFSSYNQFFDASSLQKAATQTYIGTIPAFASENLVRSIGNLSARSGPVATISFVQDRLYANWTPIIILIAGLGAICLLLILLVITRPENVVPRDPNSIAAAATVLSRSFELHRLLRKLQSPQNKGIAAALNGYEVGTAIAIDDKGTQSFKIHVTEGRPQRDVEEITPSIRFWHPIWASIPMLALTVCALLAMIAGLQVAQYFSDKNQGLFTVPDDRSSLIGSHYVSAFVTLVLASMVNNIDFYVALFAPWSSLRRSNILPEHSILINALGHDTANRLLVTARAKYWGAFLSTLATITASLLTVVISGMFLIQTFDTTGPVRSLNVLDSWNIASGYSAYTVSNDSGAAAMLNLIEHNASFPPFTYEGLAFPRLALGNLQTDLPYGSTLVGGGKGILSALQGNLTCDNAYGVSITTDGSNVQVAASYDVPQNCLSAIDSLQNNTVSFATDFTPTSGSKEFGGRQFDLRFGTNSSKYGHLGEANSSLVGNNPAAGCPSLAFIWGNFELGNNDNSAVNVLVCYQKILDVTANVVLQQNTTNFDTRYPPIPHEPGTPRPNPNGSMNVDVFDFRIQQNLARQLNGFGNYSSNVDSFFQALINGNAQTDISMLVSNSQMALVAISHTYSLYMAQVYSTLMRSQSSTGSKQIRQASTVNSLQTTITSSRLVVDRPSKLALQILLALSVLLIVGGYFLTKMRNVLPCNPCSIAGTMSLLAGSDLCYAPDNGVCECCGKIRRSLRSIDGRQHIETIHADDEEHGDDTTPQVIRQGAEWMDDEYFRRVFEGMRYSLGWWEVKSRSGTTKRYGVDIGTSPNGQEEGEWYLGKRRNNSSYEIFMDEPEPRASRGRTRALLDVNNRGKYQRAEPSPGAVDELELRPVTAPSRPGREANYGDG